MANSQNVYDVAPNKYWYPAVWYSPPVPRYVKTEADCTPYYKKCDLDSLRQNIEDKGLARQDGDTLEKRGISVDGFLNPSSVKDLKNIQHYDRMKPSIKQEFLVRGEINAEITEFSTATYQRPGHKWDALLSNWIKRNRFPVIPNSPTLEDKEVAHRLISCVEQQHNLTFLDSKIPLFGFMREAAKDQKKHPKLYLWQGEADAIAYSCALEKYVIVDFKVVDDLLDYCEKKTDLCGKHLHQCLVYAKLLQLHMKLDYLPPCLIVVIHKVTGKEGYFALFKNYPIGCYKKLDGYEWFKEQPPKRPLKIHNPEKLLDPIYIFNNDITRDTLLKDLFFNSGATVKDPALKTSWATMALKSFHEKNNINDYSMTFNCILKKQLLDVRIENVITVILAVWFTVHLK